MTESQWEHESRWTMGRVVPRDLLAVVGAYLHRAHPARRAYLLAVIRRRAEEMREEDADLPVDEPARAALALSATVLAAHETLREVFDGDGRATTRFLREALGAALRRPREIPFGALSRREDPFGAIEDACRAGSPSYGEHFDVRWDRSRPDALEMRVERCAFLDFFARHGVREVTTVMCAWDAHWLRAVDPAVSGLRGERTSAMSLGDDACRFRLVRTDDPRAAYADVVS